MTILEEIAELKTKRNALILAHNYTKPEIQDIADFVGDSLELSPKAAECTAPVIVARTRNSVPSPPNIRALFSAIPCGAGRAETRRARSP